VKIIGHVDLCNAEEVVGWIADADNPDEKVALQVLTGQVSLGYCLATQSRPDLAGKLGDGRCGFKFKLPENMPAKALRNIRLQVKDSNVALLPDFTDEEPEATDAEKITAGAPRVTVSQFGGMWIDRIDFIDKLAEKHRKGELSDDLTMQICKFVRDGYLVIPGAVAPEMVDALNDEIETFWQTPPKGFMIETFEPDGKQKVIPADVRYREGTTKALDLYAQSPVARAAIASPKVMEFLTAVFDAPPLAFQGLTFWNGSQQAIHKDTAYVKVDGNKMALCATWLALEDITPGSGELEYFVGSHRAPDFVFGGVDTWMMAHAEDHPRFLQSLQEDAKKFGHVKSRFHAKKGDVLVWHADLAHGGSPVTQPGVTRRSLVTHYCPQTQEPYYRRAKKFRKLATGGCTFVSEHRDVG
jgi:phytanoyl-CoA hydroxylase